MRTRSIAGVFAVFNLVILVLVSCIHTPIAGLSVELPPIEGPGRFEIKIIVINATLVGAIACDNGVTITPAGLPYVQGDQEITPAILEIPPSFPEGMVTCFVPTTAKRFPFTIRVGPLGPPKIPPPQIPLRLSLSKTSIACEFAGQKVTLRLTMSNELSKPVTVMSIKSANPLLTLTEVSRSIPLTLAPKEEKELSLYFACNALGFVKTSFVELKLADGSVVIL